LVLVGLLLLVFLLLLLPDLSEVSIHGLVSLKRQVTEQARKTEHLEQEVQRLSLSASQQMNVAIYPKDLEEADTEIRQKVARLEAGEVPVQPPEPRTGLREPSPERAILEAHLLAV
jgi:hypothetical protein